MGKPFYQNFAKSLSKIRWNDPKNVQGLTVQGNDGNLYNYLLPSFIKLLKHLVESKRDFVLMIRTFGRDVPHILRALNLIFKGMHPDFPEFKSTSLTVPISFELDKMYRYENPDEQSNPSHETMEYRVAAMEVSTDPSVTNTEKSKEKCKIFHTPHEVLNYWNTRQKSILAVQDDFTYWQNHEYSHQTAKLFWVDPNCSNVQHIFFDDNIRIDDPDNIIDLRLLDLHESSDSQTQKKGSPSTSLGKVANSQNLKDFEEIFFSQVELLECINNPNYYIEKLKNCEEKFRNLQKTKKTKETPVERKVSNEEDKISNSKKSPNESTPVRNGFRKKNT